MASKSKSIYTRHARYTVEKMDCPLCGYRGGKKWGECLKREVVYLPEITELITKYVVCPKCKLIYASNAVVGYNFYAEPSKLDPRIIRAEKGEVDSPLHKRFALDRIQANYDTRSGFSLLDVGCSGGELLEMAINQGIHCTGVEINPHSASLARKKTGVTIHEGDMGKISISDRYDVVNCTEVLEHIRRPHPFIQSIYNVLRPEGMLHLTTQPNTSSLRSRLLKCKNNMVRNVFSHHLLYNPSAIKYLLKTHGFRRIKFHHFRDSGRPLERRIFMKLAGLFGYFDDQVIVTAWKKNEQE